MKSGWGSSLLWGPPILGSAQGISNPGLVLRSERTARRVLALHAADQDSIPNIHKVLQAPPGVIPKFRALPQPCALPTIALKQIKTIEVLLTLAELETAVSPSHSFCFSRLGSGKVSCSLCISPGQCPCPLSSLNCE